MTRQSSPVDCHRPAGRLRHVVAAVRLAAAVVLVIGIGRGGLGQDEKSSADPASASKESAETKSAVDGSVGSDKTGAVSDPEAASGASGNKADQAATGEATVKPVSRPPEPTPDRLRPYRVLLSLAMVSDPLVSEKAIQQLRRDVALVLERTIGETWQCEIQANDWLLPATVVGLDRVTATGMLDRYQQSHWDRVMLVTVSRTGTRFEVAGRTLNLPTRALVLSRRRQEHDRRGLASTVARLARDMFRATVHVDLGGAKGADVTVRAGEFPVADPDSEQLRVGDQLEPFLRYRDRKTNKVVRVQLFPWTYLTVAERTRASARCELATALRNPLRGGGRRVDLMAVGIAPVLETTRITLLPRRNRNRPLIGHRVVVLSRRLTKKAASTAAPDAGALEADDEKKKRAALLPPRRLLSDRRGRVEIGVDEKMPLIWMYVMSGKSVMARVPFVPGRVPEIELLLPDDATRLGVEGQVARLRGELIDTVAQRAVQMALVNKMIDAETPDRSKIVGQMKKIDGLPTLKSFQDELESIEFPAIQSAMKIGNKVSASRIRRICNDTRALFSRHLDELKLNDLRDRVKKALKPRGDGN
mgnify:CR=1 FL=1